MDDRNKTVIVDALYEHRVTVVELQVADGLERVHNQLLASFIGDSALRRVT